MLGMMLAITSRRAQWRACIVTSSLLAAKTRALHPRNAHPQDAHAHARAHSRTGSGILVVVSKRARAHTHTRTNARMHERTNARTHARTRAHTHARTHERTNARTHERTRARAHTHKRAHPQVLGILVITSAEIAVVMCYFQLCSEDYHWWWRCAVIPMRRIASPLCA
jgi:hypothetical protein